MSQIQIGQGPGNLVPDSEKKMFKATAAIAKGEVVALDLTATLAARGYSITLADSDGGLTAVVGVAADAIASGEWGEVYVSGYCPSIKTDASVAVGNLLVPHTVAGEADLMADTEEHLVFAVALDTDTGDYCPGIIRKLI